MSALLSRHAQKGRPEAAPVHSLDMRMITSL